MYATNPIKQNEILLIHKNIKINPDRHQQAQEATKELEYIIKAVQNATND